MTSPWPAPAKLNLFLHIVGRQADGYHLLQTVFQFLDHCDWIDLQPRADGRIRRLSEHPGLDPASDLVMRAARLLQSHTGSGQGVDIRVTKTLPMGGGLGGGSSDAATVLVGLNRLWECGLSVDRLADLGLALGADVPVFVRGQAAWAEGVGDRLVPIDLEEPWYVVIMPPVNVSTAVVFGDPRLTRNTHPIKISDFLSGGGGNDCEPVVRARYPEVGLALDWLTRYGPARLTGTGACVFAALDDEPAAREVLARVPAQWQAFAAKGLNRSPLLERLAREG